MGQMSDLTKEQLDEAASMVIDIVCIFCSKHGVEATAPLVVDILEHTPKYIIDSVEKKRLAADGE